MSATLYFLQLTHDEEFDSEPDYYQVLELKERLAKCEAAIRMVLPFVPDQGHRDALRDAIGELSSNVEEVVPMFSAGENR